MILELFISSRKTVCIGLFIAFKFPSLTNIFTPNYVK